jgi:hypothetical protein
MSAQKLRIVESTVKRMSITPSTMERLDPTEVAKALGAEPTGVTLPPTSARSPGMPSGWNCVAA